MLLPGRTIAVVSPAGIFDPDRLRAGVALVRSWGYEVVEEPYLHATFRYTAGTLAERVRGLAWALTAPGIDAVWFARGGYGTASLLSHLPWSDLDLRPVIGFSDATALFAAMRARRRGRGVHGPVLQSLSDLADDDSRAAIRATLAGEAAWLPGRLLAGPDRSAEGPVIGGNLSVLASLCGTPWSLDARDAIVVLEEIGEAPYRVDRLLSQLVAAGFFEGARGIALGELCGCDAPQGAGWTVEDVVLDLLAPLGLPVVAGLPVGHGPRNHAWVHGAHGRLGPDGLRVDGLLSAAPAAGY